MKSFFLFLLGLLCLSIAHAQLRTDEKMPTTSTLPEGTTFQKGKIILMNGYRATYGVKDNKVLIIQKTSNLKMAGNGLTGSFNCSCMDAKGASDCQVIITKTEILCTGGTCKDCSMVVVVKPSKAGLAITRGTQGEWKKLVLPKNQ